MKPPYRDGARAIREFEEVMACLDSTMEATQIEGKEGMGKTSSLLWGPRKNPKPLPPSPPAPPRKRASGRRSIEGL